MKKGLKTVILFLLTAVLLLSAFGCKNYLSPEEKAQRDAQLVETLMKEAQLITDFMRDQKFIYGDAKINPGINWEHLDPAKAIDPYEKVVSCDRLVDWILYRAGFTDQVYDQGTTVWYMGAWCEEQNFERIDNVEELKAGDIVFVNPDSQGRPAHVFMCASTMDEYGMYLRYDAGSNERIQCKKGTEATPGQQPFREPIAGFMYAYRPNASAIDEDYVASDGNSKPVEKISFEIPYGTATIDGKIDKDEYKAHYTMDKDSCMAWMGSVKNAKTEIYFAWDEEGLYYAGQITDNTPAYSNTDNEWNGADCIQLAVNPGNLIEASSGIFFTFGATGDNNVVAYRSNYSELNVTDKIQSAACGHTVGSDSYVIEVKIPWNLMKLKVTSGNIIDLTSFEPKKGAELGLLPCVIDCDNASSTIKAAYRHNNTNFNTNYFVSAILTK